MVAKPTMENSITESPIPTSKRNTLFLGLITGLMLFAKSVSAMPLTCQINLLPQSENKTSNKLEALVEFTLTNESSDTVPVLLWNSPWEGWKNRFLKVSVNDEPLEYQGAMMKRGEPTASDFITLPSNETLTKVLNLADAYTLQTGHYTVRYHGIIYTRPTLSTHTTTDTEQEMNLQKLDCPVLEFDLK